MNTLPFAQSLHGFALVSTHKISHLIATWDQSQIPAASCLPCKTDSEHMASPLISTGYPTGIQNKQCTRSVGCES
eukprot:10314245-Ditylum_brightwellii.AAC.2